MKMLLVMLLIISCEQNTKQNESKLNLKDTDQDGLIDINDKMPLIVEDNIANISFNIIQNGLSQTIKPQYTNLLWKKLVNEIGSNYHSTQLLEIEKNTLPLFTLNIPNMFSEKSALELNYVDDNEDLRSVIIKNLETTSFLKRNKAQVFFGKMDFDLFFEFNRKKENYYKLIIVDNSRIKSYSVISDTPLKEALQQIDEESFLSMKKAREDFQTFGSNQFDENFVASFIFNSKNRGFEYRPNTGEEIIILNQNIGYFRDHFAETEKETITIEHDEINIDLPNISQVNLISRLDISIPKIKTRIVGCRFEIPFSGTAKLSIKEHFVEYQKLSNINDAFDLYLNDQKIGLAKLRATKFPRFQNNVLKLRKKFGDNKSMNIGFKDSNTKAKSFKKCSKDFVRNFSKGIYQQSYPVKWNGKIIAEKRVHI